MKLKAPEQLADFFVALATGEIRGQTGESVDYERIYRSNEPSH